MHREQREFDCSSSARIAQPCCWIYSRGPILHYQCFCRGRENSLEDTSINRAISNLMQCREKTVVEWQMIGINKNHLPLLAEPDSEEVRSTPDYIRMYSVGVSVHSKITTYVKQFKSNPNILRSRLSAKRWSENCLQSHRLIVTDVGLVAP